MESKQIILPEMQATTQISQGNKSIRMVFSTEDIACAAPAAVTQRLKAWSRPELTADALHEKLEQHSALRQKQLTAIAEKKKRRDQKNTQRWRKHMNDLKLKSTTNESYMQVVSAEREIAKCETDRQVRFIRVERSKALVKAEKHVAYLEKLEKARLNREGQLLKIRKAACAHGMLKRVPELKDLASARTACSGV